MATITSYASDSSPASNDVLPIVDVSDTTMSSTGTTKQVTVATVLQSGINGTASNIAAAGNQAPGSTGLSADSGHVHPAGGWSPADHGLAAWAYDPALVAASVAPASGTLYMIGLKIRSAVTVSNIYLVVGGTAAATPTAGKNYAGLYSSSTLLASTALDNGTTYTYLNSADAVAQIPITSQALTAGEYWVGLWLTGTTMPTLGNMWGGTVVSGLVNLGLSATTYRSATGGTPSSSLPSSTPALTIGGKNYWAAIG